MKLVLKLSLLFFLLPFSAKADADGVATYSDVKCDVSLFTAVDAVCNLFSKFADADVCQVTSNVCYKGTQELFTGANLDLTGPVRNWTGFGGGGAGYAAANLCLLRDLKDGAITSESKAASFLGDVSTQQTVQFESFDKDKFEWVGWQRTKACAPVVGCLDIITQRIRAKATSTPYPPGSGTFAGEYAINGTFGIEVEAAGLSQAMKTTIPAIVVDTPYGAISVKPEFGMGRAIGFVLAPWSDANFKSGLSGVWGTAKMIDLYGRSPGLNRTQTYPTYGVFGNGVIDNRVIGYVSQMGMGSRDADPKSAPWAPAPAVEYPTDRPDLDITKARSPAEKNPNAYLGASVRVEYSPVDLIPEEIRSNPYITIAFDVWAKPQIQTTFSSQFDIQHFEIADGRKLLTPTGPIDYHPGSMDQWKGVNLIAGASSAARVALEAGIDLVIHLKVPLFWPLDDIDLDLINTHPIVTPLESVVRDSKPSLKTAYAFTQSSVAGKTGEWFQQYHKFNGAVPSGKAEVTACLAAPSTSQPPPPPPTYTPGNPSDLTKILELPCNICIGMNTYKYLDNKGVEHTVPGFLKQLFPASEAAMPAADRWTCDNVYESGCYDMCTWDAVTKKMTVRQTALQLIASGKTTGMPPRCR